MTPAAKRWAAPARAHWLTLLCLIVCTGCGRSKSTDELIADLGSDQERDRIIAIRLLPQRKQEADRVIPVMIQCLHDKQGDVRLSAAIGLGTFGDAAKTAIPGLREAESDRDPRVRRAAGIAITRIDPSQQPKPAPKKGRKT